MRYWVGTGGATLVLAGVVCAAPAWGQRPVCPPLSAGGIHYTACRKGGPVLVRRFLDAFSIDHLFKIPPPSFTRTPVQFISLLVEDETVADVAIAAYLGSLDAVEFTRLDTSTGMFEMEVGEKQHAFEWTAEVAGVSYRAAVSLPPKIAGGYWRTPGVLQMVFWQEGRPRVEVRAANGVKFAETLSCLAISGDGIRVVAADPGGSASMLTFGACQ